MDFKWKRKFDHKKGYIFIPAPKSMNSLSTIDYHVFIIKKKFYDAKEMDCF